MQALRSKTDPAWAEHVCRDLDALLVDHAHCEKKAAGTAINLIFRHPEHGFLLEPLSKLAREELTHFEQVLGHLAARGTAFCAQKPAPYAGRLREATRNHEPARLVDTLLCCALIEARSCERFAVLAESEAVPDTLRRFYADLRRAEARHHVIYVELASGLEDADAVRERLDELATREAEILGEGPPWIRLHASGA